MVAENPFLEERFAIPFDRITPAHVEPAIDFLLEDAKAQLEALVEERQGSRTFEDTMLAYEAITRRVTYVQGIAEHLKRVESSPELVAALDAVKPKITEFCSNVPRDERVYAALKAYAATDEAHGLEGARKRFLKQTMDKFRRSGAELDAPAKARLSEIDVRLDKLCFEFDQHLQKANDAYALVITDESRLDGLPEREKQIARQRAQTKDEEGWLFDVTMNSYRAVMKYADDRELRREIYLAYNSRGSQGEHDNRDRIVEILKLRQEKAELLGYENFADLILEDRMAGNGATAKEFIADIQAKVKAHAKREHSELESFCRDELGFTEELMPWDEAYYAEKFKKAKFDFDPEELRPYFAFENVIQAFFDLANNLYGVTIEEDPSLPTWNGDLVTAYRVTDEDGTHLGSFYLDCFPREAKREGGWMDELFQGYQAADGEFLPSLALFASNLTLPVDGQPSLLSINDVKTVFHELGHVMHQVLSRTELQSHSGPNVAWDAVELPSQIMENWVTDEQVLAGFAKHYETGKPMPKDLLDKLRRAETFRKASARSYYNGMFALDLALHTEYDPEIHGDVVDYAREYVQGYDQLPLPPEFSRVTWFYHIFSDPVGYGCGMYSYLWSEVLDADAFSKFEADPFSREVGIQFRHLLEQGDSRPAADLFRDFMGRDLDADALLRRDELLN